MKLFAPEEFYSLTQNQLSEISNGCGPSGYGWLVPDRFRLIGVDFTSACDIHDFCYNTGVDKNIADKMFFDNMTIIANSKNFIVRPIAHILAFQYYLGVKVGGKGAYSKSKKEI